MSPVLAMLLIMTSYEVKLMASCKMI